MASGDALRVKTKTTTTLSITIAGMTYNTVTVAYTFQWYTKNGHSATIDADTNQTATGASYSAQGTNAVGDYYSSPENLLNLYLSAREVHMLLNCPVEAGQNIIPIDPSKLTSGTYFIRVTTEGITATRKLIITK